jgi:Carboxypeptidase regulatory-like domain
VVKHMKSLSSNTFIAFLIVLSICGYSVSQQPAPASLQGVVVEAATNKPLANAAVELRPSAGGAVVDSITTGADGAFVFPAVKPGPYRLSAMRPGYVKTEYGQRQAGGPSLILPLAPGQRVADARLIMTPGGVISGRVTEKGQPVGIADVFAIRVAYYEGQIYPTPVLSAKTNDLGEYRIFWLPPGRYYVATMINDFASNSPVFLNPEGDNGLSAFGTRFPMRAVLNRAIGSGAGDDAMHVPTFFPGTVNPDVALQIDLRAGAEARNIDINSPALPVRHVRGAVMGMPAGPRGEPIRPNVRLVPLDMATALGSATVGLPEGITEANGLFDLERVPPGSYAAIASAGGLTASVPLEVRDRDANNVVINLGSGLSLNGKITIERPAPLSPDPVMAALRVSLISEPLTPGSPSFNASVAPNGLLRIPQNANAAGILSGNYRVVVQPILQPRSEPGRPIQVLPPALQNTYVKSIRLGDRDVMADGLPLQNQVQESLEIVVGTNPGSVEGRVLNDQRQPAGAVWVALIPESKLRFRLDHKFTSTDAEGRFEIGSVPPGEYKIFAWEDIEKLGWQEPSVVRPYEGRGVVVRVEEGKKTTVDVTSIPAGN